MFIDNIIFRHGAPRKPITDRGSNCTANLMKEVCRMLNINKVYTYFYHPQSDKFVEKVNGIII